MPHPVEAWVKDFILQLLQPGESPNWAFNQIGLPLHNTVFEAVDTTFSFATYHDIQKSTLRTPILRFPDTPQHQPPAPHSVWPGTFKPSCNKVKISSVIPLCWAEANQAWSCPRGTKPSNGAASNVARISFLQVRRLWMSACNSAVGISYKHSTIVSVVTGSPFKQVTLEIRPQQWIKPNIDKEQPVWWVENGIAGDPALALPTTLNNGPGIFTELPDSESAHNIFSQNIYPFSFGKTVQGNQVVSSTPCKHMSNVAIVLSANPASKLWGSQAALLPVTKNDNHGVWATTTT